MCQEKIILRKKCLQHLALKITPVIKPKIELTYTAGRKLA